MAKAYNRLNNKILVALLTSMMLPGTYSCHNNSLGTVKPKMNSAAEKSAQLIDAGNAFGFELFRNIRNSNNKENLLISPFSVSVALAMAYNGAGTTTKAEIEKVLQFNGLTPELINGAYQKLITEFQSLDEQVVFEIANALYYSETFSIKPGFVSTNREIYNAEVTGLNFSSPSAEEVINNWVAKRTKGKINEIIQQLKPMDRMLLLNAVYFYGTWSKEFDKQGTQNLEFYIADGSTIRVPMMNKLDTLPYLSEEHFKAIQLPYGSGRYNMVVLLPQKGKTPVDITGALSAENWQAFINKFEITNRVDVKMPRFKFEFDTSLKKVLDEMGIQKAFIPEAADFSGISEEDLFINEIKHKSYIDVNETGTEAAAVTSAGFATTSFREEPPTVPFIVDRPFLFAITDTQTGVILFLGEVQHPGY